MPASFDLLFLQNQSDQTRCEPDIRTTTSTGLDESTAISTHHSGTKDNGCPIQIIDA